MKNENIFTKIENWFSPKAKTLIGATILGAMLILGVLAFNNTNVTSATVMLTSLTGGGGSGVIIESSRYSSKILTNAHVCEILKNGGLVRTVGGRVHAVSYYQVSAFHDICLATVSANLEMSTSFSRRSPRMYEKATVSGHPNLLPNVLSSGHFSGNKIIEVLTGVRKCQNSDFKNPNTRLFCDFFGVIPIIKAYETVLVTAMIMPGSSGSGIYNSDTELSSLVFAGNRNMGYAFAVPYEYVGNFLANELESSEKVYPNYTFSPFDLRAKAKSQNETLQKIKTSCKNVDQQKLKKVCDIISRDIEWRNYEKNLNFTINPWVNRTFQ